MRVIVQMNQFICYGKALIYKYLNLIIELDKAVVLV